MALELRQVKNEEVEECFDLLQQVGKWLRGRGRRQRVADLPFDQYLVWQKQGVNFRVQVSGTLAGIFSLPVEQFDIWPDFRDQGPAPWLRTLATHPDFRGQGIGRFAVQSALLAVGSGCSLWLDCVSDFLPDYYQALGFQTVASQTRSVPAAESFEITLMRHPNVGSHTAKSH